jgi:putative CocE/NonD family hydrolase
MYQSRKIIFVLFLFGSVSLFGCTNDGNEEQDSDTATTSESGGDSTETDSGGAPTDGADAGDEISPCAFKDSILPAPAGPYCIGVTDYDWVDPDRGEPFTLDDSSDTREVSVRIFYPSASDATLDFGVYVTQKKAAYLAAQNGLPSDMETALADIKVHFRVDASPADIKKPFPVLLFSPGFGSSVEQYTALLEDAASRGVVVIAVNHPYVSGLTEFPDGRSIETVIPTDLIEFGNLLDDNFQLLVDDMKFALDKVLALNAFDPSGRFTNRLKTARIGAFGHSLGGAAALALLEQDDRVKAGVNMDGSVGYPGMNDETIDLPVMVQLAGSHSMSFDPTIEALWGQLTGPRFVVGVETAVHASYTDWPVLIASFYPGQDLGMGTVDPMKMTELVREYNAAFFDAYLRDGDPEEISALKTEYPDGKLMDADNPPQPGPTVTSLYLTMKDDTRIAANVYLPFNAGKDHKVPTAVRATRYWRDMEVVFDSSLSFQTESANEARMWTDAGYALVLVDARGTGASFGRWSAPWSETERSDLGEIVDWITTQEWSDGHVGSQGISYDGNAADFIGLLGAEAVKVAAPLFSDWNVYEDVAYPGGIFNEGFVQLWNLGNLGLDANDVCAAFLAEGAECDYLRQIYGGVRPTDGDEDHTLLDAAVSEHKDNLDVFETCLNAPYIDSSIGETSYMGISPAAYTESLGTGAPAYLAQASWMDASVADGALSRFAASKNNSVVYIGPWSHGGAFDADPFLDPETPVDPPIETQSASMIQLFNYYMTDDEPPAMRQIQYYTLGEGEWRTTDVWPPSDTVDTALYLRSEGALTLEGPNTDEAEDTYTVDFAATTGDQNRWWTQAGGNDVVYPDRAVEDEKLLTYTSAPLESDLRITGYPEVHIMLSSTHEDGALFVYLEDVDLNGQVTYITEGELRLIHRAVFDNPPPWHVFGPYHSYLEKDAAPMVPGEIVEIAIALEPTAVLIKAGHSIRVALAGHDASNFTRLPKTGDPVLSIFHDQANMSRIILPVN